VKSFNKNVFNSRLFNLVLAWYRRVFFIEEIEQSLVLKWVFGATLFSHFVAFNSWFYQRAMTVDTVLAHQHVCWPYFQNCGDFAFLRTLPEGYSQPFLYAFLFGTLLASFYFIYKRDWLRAHATLVPSFVWHTLGTFVLTGALSGNYEYYMFALTGILLFFPHKEFFLRLVLVLFYFLAGALKIHEGWILGTYFSAIKIGLPLFPDWSIPIWTNLVIFMEIVGAWFLFSKKWILQRLSLSFWTAFHLYSSLLVGFRYPSVVLPTLLILFGGPYRKTLIPCDRKSIVAWVLVGALIPLQFVSVAIPGDTKLTLEGNKYGLYMFEANHQCISQINMYDSEGVPQDTSYYESENARNRCDPYSFWFRMQQECDVYSGSGMTVAWTFDHSINGGPFLRIVDEKDVCALKYKAFGHNEWIKTEKDNPPVIGYPVENIYY